MLESREVDVAVVGAGLAGLTAASEIVARGRSVLVLEARDRVGDGCCSGEMPMLNPLVLADLAQATMRVERLARRVPLDRPWESKRAGDWDAQTLATWLRRAVKTSTARAILDLDLSTLLAAETASVSLRGLDPVREGVARADRAPPLGRDLDIARLELLHGRCGQVEERAAAEVLAALGESVGEELLAAAVGP